MNTQRGQPAPITQPTSNTDSVRSTDRVVVGLQPDDSTPTGTITSGGSGSGTVTSITAGTRLSGGTITTTGTIALAASGVSAATYGDATHVAQIAVNAEGQITSASNVGITSGGTGTVTSVATGTGLTGGPITTSGAVSLVAATDAALGGVIPDGTIITVSSGDITVAKATSSAFGVVKPDGTIVTVSGGAITVAKATSGAFGVVEVDGTSITASGGVITATTSTVFTDWFNVATYGASPSGSASDNLTYINNAIAALNSAGSGTLCIPAIYDVSGALTTITVPCQIFGYGQGLSGITTTSASANVFTLSSASACRIQGLSITPSVGLSTGYGISFAGAGSGVLNGNSLVQDCFIQYFARGISLVNTADTTVQGCTLANNTSGVYYANDNVGSDSDAEAGFITGCSFVGNYYGIYGVNNEPAVIVGNDFYSNSYHYRLDLMDNIFNGGNSDIRILGNAFDRWLVRAISFNGPATTGVITNTIISGNSFSAIDGGGGNVIEVLGGPIGWFGNFAITGNQFQYAETASGDAIHLVNSFRGTISGNQFFQVGGYSGYAIYIDSSCSEIAYDPYQQFHSPHNVPVVDNQALPSVASASTITLPTWGTFIRVTGTTNIQTIDTVWQGRRMSFLCLSSVSFVTGGNIAAAVAVPAGGMCNGVFDGTNWFLT